MAATASRLGPPVDPTTRRTLIAGTTLFLVSDSALGPGSSSTTDPKNGGGRLSMSS